MSFGVLTPRPIGNEHRIKVINYMPNSVIKFVGHYMYHSIIEFGPDEEIDTITMGTPTGWQMHPEGNRIFLKPINEDATTNMTVITNKRMYFFEMYAEYAKGLDDKNLAFIMKFIYPEKPGTSVSSTTQNGFSPPDLSDPSPYNFHYRISGKRSVIEPVIVFDDGEFTYIKFRNINTEVPSVYVVSSDGSEALINYKIYAGYMVIERVAGIFTLRHGHDTICLFNEDFDEIMGSDYEKT